jgi:hypothetical protein
MLPKSLFSIPNSPFIDHASQDLHSRDGAEDFLSWHVCIIDSYNSYGSWSCSQNILSDFLKFRLDWCLNHIVWGSWSENQRCVVDSSQLYTFPRARRASDQNRLEISGKLIDNERVSNRVYCFHYYWMKRLFLLIDELGKFLVPVFETYLDWIKVEILNMIIIGIYYVLE